MELLLLKEYILDFPGGPVVKNPPANARDMNLIPGPGRSHMLRPHALQWRGPCAITTEPVHWQPVLHNKRSHCSETPELHKPCSPQLVKSTHNHKDPAEPKINK